MDPTSHRHATHLFPSDAEGLWSPQLGLAFPMGSQSQEASQASLCSTPESWLRFGRECQLLAELRSKSLYVGKTTKFSAGCLQKPYCRSVGLHTRSEGIYKPGCFIYWSGNETPKIYSLTDKLRKQDTIRKTRRKLTCRPVCMIRASHVHLPSSKCFRDS